MYHSESIFRIINREYNVEATVVGWENLARITINYIKRGIIWDSFKKRLAPIYIEDYFTWGTPTEVVECVIEDSEGRIVPVNRIREFAKTFPKPEFSYRYRRTVPAHVRFRRDPVPYTGVNRHFRRSHLNYRKYTGLVNELKADLKHKGYVRAKRHQELFYMNDQWLEDIRGDVFIKQSWKKNKKRKQWMTARLDHVLSKINQQDRHQFVC